MLSLSPAALRGHATALLRISLGLMFLSHSILLKLATFGMAGTVGFFASVGLPAWLAYVTVIAEIAGGLMLVLGIGTRAAALALSPILLGAWYVHAGNGWVFTAANGGWEYPAYLFVLCLAQAMFGAGSFALRPHLDIGNPRLSQAGGSAQ